MNRLHRFCGKIAKFLAELVRAQACTQAKLVKEAAKENFLWTASAREGLVFCFWIGPR